MTTTTENQAKVSRPPTHIAYKARKGSDGKTYRERVGVLWRHKKGDGLNLQLDAFPLDGKIVIFPLMEKQDETEEVGE